MSIWDSSPSSSQYPNQSPPGNGIKQLIDRIRGIERQISESTANLLRASGVRLTPTGMLLTTVPVYANNAAAIAGGLAVGGLYRNGADPDHLCIVH